MTIASHKRATLRDALRPYNLAVFGTFNATGDDALEVIEIGGKGVFKTNDSVACAWFCLDWLEKHGHIASE